MRAPVVALSLGGLLVLGGCAAAPAPDPAAVSDFVQDLRTVRAGVQEFIAAPPAASNDAVDCDPLSEWSDLLQDHDVLEDLPAVGRVDAKSAVDELESAGRQCRAGGNALTPLNDFVLFSGDAIEALTSR